MDTVSLFLKSAPSSNDINQERLDQIKHTQLIYFLITAITTMVYLFQFVIVILRFKNVIRKDMKTILVTFLVCMSLQAIFHALMVFRPLIFDRIEAWNSDLHQSEIFVQMNSSIFMILFYKVMFLFKRVQEQVSEQYQSMDEIVRALTRQLRFEKLFILLGFLVTASVEVFYIFGWKLGDSLQWTKYEEAIWIIYLVSSFLLLLINFYMLY